MSSRRVDKSPAVLANGGFGAAQSSLRRLRELVCADLPTRIERRTRLSPPYAAVQRAREVTLIQRKHEQIARALQLVVFHGMYVAAAGLHREILLRADRISHRRALERRADIEAPELLERLVL